MTPTNQPDSQAGDDDPTEAIQRLCDDKILISSTELAERFTKLYNHYADRLATKRELYGRLHQVIELFQSGQLSAEAYSKLHGDLTDRIAATLTKETDNANEN